MKNIIAALVISMLTVCVSYAAESTYYHQRVTRMDINLVGTGWKHTRTDIPNFEGEEFVCFGGLQLVDMATNRVVGTGNDCLGRIKDNNGIINLQGHTFLDFFHENDVHTLMVQGKVTVAPVAVPTTAPNGMKVTHITGASTKGRGGVIGGSGIYDGAVGNIRLSGMVDMSSFARGGNHIVFDCIFRLSDLKLADWAIR